MTYFHIRGASFSRVLIAFSGALADCKAASDRVNLVLPHLPTLKTGGAGQPWYDSDLFKRTCVAANDDVQHDLDVQHVSAGHYILVEATSGTWLQDTANIITNSTGPSCTIRRAFLQRCSRVTLLLASSRHF